MSQDKREIEKVEAICGNCEMFKYLPGDRKTVWGECKWKILSPVPFWAKEKVEGLCWGSINPQHRGCPVFWPKERKPPVVVIVDPPRQWRK